MTRPLTEEERESIRIQLRENFTDRLFKLKIERMLNDFDFALDRGAAEATKRERERVLRIISSILLADCSEESSEMDTWDVLELRRRIEEGV